MIRLTGGLVVAIALSLIGDIQHLGVFGALFDATGAVLLAWALYLVDFRTES